jgi:hypothetical protein
MVSGAMHQPRSGQDLRVLTGVKRIFFVLGVGSLGLFSLEPDFHAHPQLVLLGCTALLGTLTLHGLSRVLGPGPH